MIGTDFENAADVTLLKTVHNGKNGNQRGHTGTDQNNREDEYQTATAAPASGQESP